MFVSKNSLGCLFLLMIAAAGCGDGGFEGPPTASLDTPPPGISTNEGTTNTEVAIVPTIQSELDADAPAPQVEQFPEVTIVTSMGSIRVRLNAEKASETVDNFLYNYVNRGFYEGTVFHYVQDEFIAIAGGYDAELKAKAVGPPIRNEAGNGLKNARGTIAMSRHAEYADSATSQFYFNLTDNPTLDQTDAEKGETFGYCVFGEVIEGFEVLQKIAKVDVQDSGDFTNVPVEPITIETVRREK